ncbi:MAG TPA: hypothetical protein VGM76_07650 [Lacipirellulaceae bacterium]|jgi:hypothetical protein
MENWQVLRRDEDIDASGDAWLAADEATVFETEDHLMDRGRADAEMALHVGLGRSLTEHALVDADEGQVVTLRFGETMRYRVMIG